jgi:hypothetical protein
MRQNRTRALVAACALVVAVATEARAGDAPAHAKAANDSAANYLTANPVDRNGIGHPRDTVNGVDLPGRFPLSVDNGAAVNAPDSWSCVDGGPRSLIQANQQVVSFLEAQASYWLQAPIPGIEMLCNFTHFVTNTFGHGTADSYALVRAWADNIPRWIGVDNDRYQHGVFCTAGTWSTFQERKFNSAHFVQDPETAHHARGNIYCAATNGGAVHPNPIGSSLCAAYIGWWYAQVLLGNVPADNELATNGAPNQLSLALGGVGLAGLALGTVNGAAMGFERVSHHHSKDNFFGGPSDTTNCAGAQDDHSNNPDYCEGETQLERGSLTPNFVGPATQATDPIVASIAALWSGPCKEPDVPCVPAQVEQWCKNSTPMSYRAFQDGIRMHGYCVANQWRGRRQPACVLRSYVCIPEDQRGRHVGHAGEPCGDGCVGLAPNGSSGLVCNANNYCEGCGGLGQQPCDDGCGFALVAVDPCKAIGPVTGTSLLAAIGDPVDALPPPPTDGGVMPPPTDLGVMPPPTDLGVMPPPTDLGVPPPPPGDPCQGCVATCLDVNGVYVAPSFVYPDPAFDDLTSTSDELNAEPPPGAICDSDLPCTQDNACCGE